MSQRILIHCFLFAEVAAARAAAHTKLGRWNKFQLKFCRFALVKGVTVYFKFSCLERAEERMATMIFGREEKEEGGRLRFDAD